MTPKTVVDAVIEWLASDATKEHNINEADVREILGTLPSAPVASVITNLVDKDAVLDVMVVGDDHVVYMYTAYRDRADLRVADAHKLTEVVYHDLPGQAAITIINGAREWIITVEHANRAPLLTAFKALRKWIR